MIIRSNRIYTSQGCTAGYLEVIDGKIKQILAADAPVSADIDYGDLRIIPGIFDTHNHGGVGYRFEDCKEEDLKIALKGQAAFGVTNVLPTINKLEQFPLIAQAVDRFYDGAQILGIHSEGPWGARVGEKGINTGYPAVDLKVAQQMVELAEGKLLLVDIAPEVEQALIATDYFVSQGVTVAAYHTNATFAEANRGFDHGMSVAIHLFNVMTGLHHRDVGTAGAAILNEDVSCELIADGLHVCLPMIKLALRMKDQDKIILISDSGQYLGAPVGKYRGSKDNSDSDRQYLEVTPEGFVLSETGRLTGSARPVLYGMGNLVEKLSLPLEDVIKMASLNPSLKYGFTQKGSIEVDKDADLVVITDDYQAFATYSLGKLVFDSTTEEIPFNQEFLASHRLT